MGYMLSFGKKIDLSQFLTEKQRVSNMGKFLNFGKNAIRVKSFFRQFDKMPSLTNHGQSFKFCQKNF